jgi:predicted Fe-S protein YdhL (DUF1289 family)
MRRLLRTLEEIAAWWDCTAPRRSALYWRELEQRMARIVDGTFCD